jgi:predicted N-formylglutamate amidohydrolase
MRETGKTYLPVIENETAKGRIVLVCEHASNAFAAPWGTLGLDEAAQRAHIAWDPGALGLARGLSRRLDAVLVHAPVSRLIYDCNRPPDSPGAMPARSEVFDVPGNMAIQPQDRAARTAAVYLPFHDGLHAVLLERVALGLRPVVITIHSFTPVWFGTPRAVEFGVIHDADPTLAKAILHEAQTAGGLACALNAPYSAADGVTHTLRLHATPYGLPNAMLEIRNDLIATPAAEALMADRLFPILAAAVAAIDAPALAEPVPTA